jgi:hypothetical protein
MRNASAPSYFYILSYLSLRKKIHETLVRCNHGGQHLGDAINDVVHGATSFVQSHM